MTKMFVPVREVAEMLGISRTAAYGLVRSGSLPSVTIAGVVRVPAASLEQFASRLEAQALAGSAA
jgi:excisionase family DNA binding protein